MGRPMRADFAGAFHHVTNRGNYEQVIFRDDADRAGFLACLASAVARQGWRCHGYCLMDNHFHLLLETPEANLARGMQWFAAVWTRRHNRRHGLTGHLFQSRYHSVVIEQDSHLLEAVRYIALNPVRAGMVARAEDWPWSHHRALAGLTPVSDWLTCRWLWAHWHLEEEKAQAVYRQFVAEGRQLAPERQRPWLAPAAALPEPAALAQLRALAAAAGRDRGWMRQAHRDMGYSQTLIAEAAGVHVATVKRVLRRKSQ